MTSSGLQQAGNPQHLTCGDAKPLSEWDWKLTTPVQKVQTLRHLQKCNTHCHCHVGSCQMSSSVMTFLRWYPTPHTSSWRYTKKYVNSCQEWRCSFFQTKKRCKNSDIRYSDISGQLLIQAGKAHSEQTELNNTTTKVPDRTTLSWCCFRYQLKSSWYHLILDKKGLSKLDWFYQLTCT